MKKPSDRLKFEFVLRSPYCPDLAPNDFHFFIKGKKIFGKYYFLFQWRSSISSFHLVAIIQLRFLCQRFPHAGIHRLQKCISHSRNEAIHFQPTLKNIKPIKWAFCVFYTDLIAANRIPVTSKSVRLVNCRSEAPLGEWSGTESLSKRRRPNDMIKSVASAP